MATLADSQGQKLRRMAKKLDHFASMLYHRFLVNPWEKSEILLTQLLAMQTEI